MLRTIGCSRGDVVLVPFVFSEETARKIRPVAFGRLLRRALAL
jgi:hypothetical protein